MDCYEVNRLLGEFFDGELDEASHGLVAAHVGSCPKCAAELAALTQLDRATRQLITPEPPPDLWHRIERELSTSRAGAGVLAGGLTDGLPRRQFLLTSGAVVASAVGGLLAYGVTRWRKRVEVSEAPREAHISYISNPISANLAFLPAADRRLAESQATCAADGCDARLGADGPPFKLMLEDAPVFLCSQGCEQWALAHPRQALAKSHTLAHYRLPVAVPIKLPILRPTGTTPQ